jgi:hypothetical protein
LESASPPDIQLLVEIVATEDERFVFGIEHAAKEFLRVTGLRDVIDLGHMYVTGANKISNIAIMIRQVLIAAISSSFSASDARRLSTCLLAARACSVSSEIPWSISMAWVLRTAERLAQAAQDDVGIPFPEEPPMCSAIFSAAAKTNKKPTNSLLTAVYFCRKLWADPFRRALALCDTASALPCREASRDIFFKLSPGDSAS